MKLRFVKRGGKHDELTIVGNGDHDAAVSQTILCPKQGILPHEMIHYAVESVLARRGFLSLVEQGELAGFDTGGGGNEEGVERLVEVFQAEMWGGRVPAAELLAVYEHACQARGHAADAIQVEDIEAVRFRLDELTLQWSKLAINDEMVLDF